MLIAVDGHHLRGVDLGRGTPILLHDGWVASWDLWLPLIEVLQQEWRCIAYDHRGSGASTFPPSAMSGEALVDDVFRVLDAAGVDRCVIAGESMGCLVVEQAVLRDPSTLPRAGPGRGPVRRLGGDAPVGGRCTRRLAGLRRRLRCGVPPGAGRGAAAPVGCADAAAPPARRRPSG